MHAVRFWTGTSSRDKARALHLLLSNKLSDLPGKEYLRPSIRGGSLAMGVDMLSTVSVCFSIMPEGAD